MTKGIQEQKEFYNSYWQDLQPLSTYKVMRTKWIMDVLLKVRKQLPGEDTKLLDLGCGDGRLVPVWQALTGAEAHGLELSPQAVATAQKLYPAVVYKEGDATQTGYDNNEYDIVICQEVLEHVEEQQKLVDECARIIKTYGWLVLTTPNKLYFDNRKGGNYSNQPIEHIINKTELIKLLDKHFEVDSYETLIYARGDYGIYRFITNKYLLAILRRLGLAALWKRYLLKKGYGLHMAVVCRKRIV